MTFHIILRGIPGSGKTTEAKRLQKEYEENGKSVAVYSRDAFRLTYLQLRNKGSNNPNWSLENEYQLSFNDKNGIDSEIKDEFYNRLIDALELNTDVHIYDMTNISKDDCYFWTEFVTYAKAKGDSIKIIEMEPTNWKSTHNVPKEVMARYEKEWIINAYRWHYLEEYIES